MKATFLFLSIVFISCSNTKEVTDKAQQKKHTVLPVHIMYSGIPQSPAVINFIDNYFLSRDIKSITVDEEKKILKSELERSLHAALQNGNITTDSDEMHRRIAAQTKYAVNDLILYFKPIDSSHISLGWANLALPSKTTKTSETIKINYNFLSSSFLLPLRNEAIINLCDTVISSGTLVNTGNN